ncbi:PqiC family protein [Frigidibacter oleivorans]|uniref:PqiC family protein n=1 Tax=Frigidibacter oleivorans TaxID=2487129 RepID=UPI000F8F06C5|nr:PqiC family protein [Frigidibacter oleivorans]
MPHRLTALPVVLCLGLAACGAPPRYLLDPPPSTLRLSSAADTILLREVSLPDYAANPEITLQEGGGAVTEARRAQWADLPPRAVTLALAERMDAILSGTVAPDPWPLSGYAEAEVDVRVTRMLAGADGVFRLDGQYYVRSEGPRRGPPSAPFAISVPMAGREPAQIAAAQSAAVGQLAEIIARSMGR